MATFQLAGLPSQVVANQNAPGAPATPNYDLSNQRTNYVAQGLQGLGEVAGVINQARQAERLQQFQQALGQAYAAGDRDALKQLAATNPDQIEAIRQGMGFVDADRNQAIGEASAQLRTAASQGPEAVMQALQKNASTLQSIGVSPEGAWHTYQQSPEGFGQTADLIGLHALGPEKYFDVQDKMAGRDIDRGRLAEQVRSNQAGEALTARGQDITVRGQNISAQNAQLSANGATSDMKNYAAYSRLLKTDPEAAAMFAQVAGINTSPAGNRQVQLSDGRTVSVGGKLHGAGQNAFYEGRDNNGNVVRVPASAIAAPATSAASAGNYAMAKDLTAIENASPETLGFMTGVTGGNGSPAFGADVRSRISGKDERQVYNAAQRIQGKMQNQGIAAARDMGASGINTVAEAKMYFQGMPQIDFSSPDAVQESVRNIRQYTDQYNQQYNVNVGGRGGQQSSPPVAQQAPQPQQQAGFSSLWGD